jgi:DNA-binding PadR family transcriptional regulator
MGGRVTYLGEFEQVVLLAIVRLGDEAYGTAIRREIEARTGRWVSIGAAYATLDRLVTKGYLRARDAAGSTERGGRARRFFALTPTGIAALEDARDLQRRMWAGVQLRRAAKKS